jgi:hypothetical protein
MSQMNMGVIQTTLKKNYQIIQKFSLSRRMKKSGKKGRQDAVKEMEKLHERNCFDSIHVYDITKVEKKRALESLISLTEKRDGTIKGRTCTNRSTQRS